MNASNTRLVAGLSPNELRLKEQEEVFEQFHVWRQQGRVTVGELLNHPTFRKALSPHEWKRRRQLYAFEIFHYLRVIGFSSYQAAELVRLGRIDQCVRVAGWAYYASSIGITADFLKRALDEARKTEDWQVSFLKLLNETFPKVGLRQMFRDELLDFIGTAMRMFQFGLPKKGRKRAMVALRNQKKMYKWF